jgi:hypothetical protein
MPQSFYYESVETPNLGVSTLTDICKILRLKFFTIRCKPIGCY